MARALRARRGAGAATAAALVVGAGVAGVGAAASADAAGCQPVIDAVALHDVVLQQTATPVVQTTVTAHDPCTDAGVRSGTVVRVTGQAFLSDGSWRDLRYVRGSGATWNGTSAAFPRAAALGRSQQVVEVTDSDGNTTYRDTLWYYVRRDVTVSSVDAAPEPVRKGAYVTVSGVVRRLSVSAAGKGAYVPYSGHAVTYWFRPSSGKTYSQVGTSSSASTGRFTARFRATVDGCWKVQSTQTSQHVGRWSAADCVDVR